LSFSGEKMSTDKPDPFEFAEQIDEASWDMLKPHHERGAVFMLSDQLNLVEVATAIAKDDVGKVKSWLESKEMRQISEEEVELWEKMDREKIVNFLIVQPYVIIQKIQRSQQ
jgi:hypothetical protein